MDNNNSLKTLYNIDSLPDNLAYSLVKKEYKNFFSPAGLDGSLDELKLNSRFIILLSQVIKDARGLGYQEQVYANNIILNMLSKVVNDLNMKNLYYELAKDVNFYEIFLLNHLVGLDNRLSIIMAVTSKASFDPDTNISRVLFTISCSDLNIMTVERIRDILFFLFGKDNYEDIFMVNIKDTYLNTHDDEWINDSIININRNIDTAILINLNSLDINKVHHAILKYKRYINNKLFEKRLLKDNVSIEDIVKFDLEKYDLTNYPLIRNAITIIKESNLTD